MEILNNAAAYVMKLCYNMCDNYGVAILIFTLFSKIILLPLSIWVLKNSIRLVRIQPDVNMIKVKYFGDRERIAEEQNELYKREKYRPLISVIPTFAQLIVLMAVIAAIKTGINDPEINKMFLGIDLTLVPNVERGWFALSALAAGFSALLMCIAQNKSNVLQSEQSGWNKYGMLAFSVGLSLYLGWFVSVGVALYWVASNLFSIIQLYTLNAIFKPRKYVDYDKLEDSRKQLAELESLNSEQKKKYGKDVIKREKADYKRFFSILNKHLVFYSESSGFYKYYRSVIEYILKNTNIAIHYVTSDPNDQVFEIAKNEPNLKPYYIGEKKLITLMMKLEADVVVMTMPDLENYHIKRSYLRKDIDYIHIPHGMDSPNLVLRKGSLDHFDTIICTGPNQAEEVEKTEKLYSLPKKKTVLCGYPLLDEMREDYKKMSFAKSERKTVLIAPSWQKDNIVDSCLDEILTLLDNKDYKIIVRPHPQHVRHRSEQMEALKEKYANSKNIEIQTDFSSNNTVFSADAMITDWSGIAFEYAFTTSKPVVFINTPMKVMNPEYQMIDTVPINIDMRDKIGCSVDLDNLNTLPETVEKILRNSELYNKKIEEITNNTISNLGYSAEVEAKYIISSIQNKINARKEDNK
ncbi:MAG: membrane protein insertase YidC [Clostridia bacterium]|nr:membrane protein insertase YidC [Clostridia bacterium]